MSKTSQHKGGDVKSASQHDVLNEERKKNIWKNARFRYKTIQQIIELIRSQPEKNKKNSDLFSEWIKNVIYRASPKNLNTQIEKEISELDCYYIPDTPDINYNNKTKTTNDETINDKTITIQMLLQDDEIIYEILKWLLCRPQLFRKVDGERILSEAWLARLNYILNMAAKHTLRHINEASLLHTNSNLDEDNTPWWWDSQSTLEEGWNVRIWYNYFRDKLKDFTTSQWSVKDKKYKIFFEIKSKEHFCQLVRSLIVDYVPVISGWSQIYASTYDKDYCTYYYDKTDKKLHKGKVIHKAKEIKLKPLSTRIKDWLFLKNISCYADIERCDGYTWRHDHYEQFKTEFMEPFLQCNRHKKTQKDGSHKTKKQSYRHTREIEKLDNHELKESTVWEIAYSKHRVIKYRTVLCTKSQNSIIDKTRRDVNYSAPTNLKDMIRWTIITKDHSDLLFSLHHFIKYFIQNPEHNSAHDSSNNAWFDPERWVLRWLQLVDKWILNTEVPHWIKNIHYLPKWKKPAHDKDPYNFDDNELDWAATKFLLYYIDQSSTKKSTTANEYIDIKLIVPTLMRPNPLPVEMKFTTKDIYENNERWLSHHGVYDLAKSDQLQSRDEKFILADKLRQEIYLLLQREPELKAQIEAKLANEDRWKNNINAAEELYNRTIEKLVTVRAKYGENWCEPTLFCNRIIWDHLKNAWFGYSAEGFHYDDEESK